MRLMLTNNSLVYFSTVVRTFKLGRANMHFLASNSLVTE